MSNRPSDPAFIATRVAVEGYGPAEYPPAVPFDVGGKAIATFQGTARVFVPCDGASPPPAVADAVVRYQACTSTRCFFPVTRHVITRREP